MIEELRERFNKSFTSDKYERFIRDIEEYAGSKVLFRIAETPVFIPSELRDKLMQAGRDVIDVVMRPDIKELTERSIPNEIRVPGENAHTNFLCVDFAICKDEKGEFEPQLIEFQGFTSLFGWQADVAKMFKRHYEIPDHLDFYIDVDGHEAYVDLLRRAILNGEDPAEVITLEIRPEEQKTNIDFAIIEKWLDIRTVCLSKVWAEGDKLYYERDGVKTRVKRIYNRVIFDELHTVKDFEPGIDLTQPYEVSWAGHPNWFLRLSKFTMPYIDSPYVPACEFLSDFDHASADLSKYVLKPLFSFSGQGVIFDVTQSDIDAIPEDRRKDFIVQKKVEYALALQSPTGPVKVEVRLLYIWPDEDEQPTLAANLTRLSKGAMIGVRYNENQDWVGGTVSFMEK